MNVKCLTMSVSTNCNPYELNNLTSSQHRHQANLHESSLLLQTLWFLATQIAKQQPPTNPPQRQQHDNDLGRPTSHSQNQRNFWEMAGEGKGERDFSNWRIWGKETQISNIKHREHYQRLRVVDKLCHQHVTDEHKSSINEQSYSSVMHNYRQIISHR